MGTALHVNELRGVRVRGKYLHHVRLARILALKAEGEERGEAVCLRVRASQQCWEALTRLWGPGGLHVGGRVVIDRGPLRDIPQVSYPDGVRTGRSGPGQLQGILAGRVSDGPTQRRRPPCLLRSPPRDHTSGDVHGLLGARIGDG